MCVRGPVCFYLELLPFFQWSSTGSYPQLGTWGFTGSSNSLVVEGTQCQTTEKKGVNLHKFNFAFVFPPESLSENPPTASHESTLIHPLGNVGALRIRRFK